LLYDNNNK
jgi:hypothetical protein